MFERIETFAESMLDANIYDVIPIESEGCSIAEQIVRLRYRINECFYRS